jgi:hypothetical protein
MRLTDEPTPTLFAPCSRPVDSTERRLHTLGFIFETRWESEFYFATCTNYQRLGQLLLQQKREYVC